MTVNCGPIHKRCRGTPTAWGFGPDAAPASAATVHPASPQSSSVRLVQQYLSATGMAGSNLSKVEAALKAFGPLRLWFCPPGTIQGFG